MASATVNALVWLAVLAALLIVFSRPRRHGGGGGVGAAAAGSIYDMLSQDKRKAVEIIVEERAGVRDPEDRDGNLPDLEDPSKSR
jgi:hypothetical protein